MITTCPDCRFAFEVDIDAKMVRCPKCSHRFHTWDDDDDSPEGDPDYGGAFDGFNVSSDADPGL